MKYLFDIDINGYSYSYYSVHESEMKSFSSSNPIGLILFERQLVFIRDDLNKTQTEAAIRHEFFEALNYLYNMDLSHHQICLLETTTQPFLKIKGKKDEKKNKK